MFHLALPAVNVVSALECTRKLENLNKCASEVYSYTNKKPPCIFLFSFVGDSPCRTENVEFSANFYKCTHNAMLCIHDALVYRFCPVLKA